jgi:putative flippase GtrA
MTIHKEISKFLIVGGISTIINYGSFYILYNLVQMDYLVSSSFGYLIGLLFGYVLNRNWTFVRDKADKKIKELFLYFCVYIISLVLSLVFLKFLVVALNFHPSLGNIFAIGLSTATNFLGLKFFVFKKKNENNR